MKTLKCDNCGASLEIRENRPISFCPYCGAAVKNIETAVDMRRIEIEHEETMKKLEYEHEKEDFKNFKKSMIAIFTVLFLICLFLFTRDY